MSIAIKFYMPNLSDEGLTYLEKIAGCYRDADAPPDVVVPPWERGQKPTEQITADDMIRAEIARQDLQVWFQSWVVGAIVDRKARKLLRAT